MLFTGCQQINRNVTRHAQVRGKRRVAIKQTRTPRPERPRVWVLWPLTPVLRQKTAIQPRRPLLPQPPPPPRGPPTPAYQRLPGAAYCVLGVAPCTRSGLWEELLPKNADALSQPRPRTPTPSPNPGLLAGDRGPSWPPGYLGQSQ